MKNGLELIAGQIDLSQVEAVGIWMNDDIRLVPIEELPVHLARMKFIVDADERDGTGSCNPPGEEYDFRIYTADRVYQPYNMGGVACLSFLPRTPEAWVNMSLQTRGSLHKAKIIHTH